MVFIDACFSGRTRDDQLILAESRPIFVKVESPFISSENVALFTASTGEQISSGLPDMKHGLFTYYLLKGLKGEADKNNDGKLTIDELEVFLVENVTLNALRINREQTPQVFTRNKQRIVLTY